jgi:hypothetical protein
MGLDDLELALTGKVSLALIALEFTNINLCEYICLFFDGFYAEPLDEAVEVVVSHRSSTFANIDQRIGLRSFF